ncbi:MAG: hypothetical protein DMG81_18325 [Acidobacteria bacterium]|nr:MAG: hypothetical protein DMG81_18325 [Acidobacteriota bacterium]
MASQLKGFSVGEIQCVALNDGTLNYPPEWFFSNVNPEEVKTSLCDHRLPADLVESPYTCLLIKSGKHRVLIDTGADGLAPTTGDLFRALTAAKVSPAEVTHVVLTHGHPDHIGGVLEESGKPAFANAQYVMSKTEWDFWMGTPDFSRTNLDEMMQQMMLGATEKNLPPLKSRMELVEGEKEVVPGVSVIPAPGHTPGHFAVFIASGKQQLLHMADAVLHPLHLENPTWRSMFDLDPENAGETRRRLLDRVTADSLEVLAYHFPFPGLGHVERSGQAWKWRAEG